MTPYLVSCALPTKGLNPKGMGKEADKAGRHEGTEEGALGEGGAGRGGILPRGPEPRAQALSVLATSTPSPCPPQWYLKASASPTGHIPMPFAALPLQGHLATDPHQSGLALKCCWDLSSQMQPVDSTDSDGHSPALFSGPSN